MPRVPFFSFDGIDGTGKSTQCRLLVEWLNRQGCPAILCNDPGGTALGDQLRTILLHSKAEISARAEALLFMASRAELVERTILPALAAGKVVITDRFVTANIVYQGHAGNLPVDELWSVGRFSAHKVLPDLTIILDLPVDVANARRGRTADRMESRGTDYLQKVRDGFLAEARKAPDCYQVVDATGDISGIQRTLRQIVAQRCQDLDLPVQDES